MFNKDYASVLALNNYGTATPTGTHSTGNRGVLTSRILQQAPGGEHCCEFNFPHSLQAQAACQPLHRWLSHELAAWMASLGGAYREQAERHRFERRRCICPLPNRGLAGVAARPFAVHGTACVCGQAWRLAEREVCAAGAC